MMRYLIGPELFWILLYSIATILAKNNIGPSKSMDDFLQNCWIYIPLLSISIFALWYFPMIERNGLLIRVWVAGIFGAHFVLEKMLGAISIQGPGVGTSYLAGMLFEFCILIIGSVIIWFLF